MRKQIVAGNWKMNCDLSETKLLLEELTQNLTEETSTEVIVSPPYTSLMYTFDSLKSTAIKVAAQNLHPEDNGAFTGEISAKMLKSVGVSSVIIGHSERRSIFQESNEFLAEKVNQAIKHAFQVIFCVGETLESRQQEQHFEVVKNQLEESLFQLSPAAMKNVVIAYEPVWAIGTGETASPEQAQEMHAFIRHLVKLKFDDSLAENTSILYGGSVKPNNAKEIFSKQDVDGGLIGGAALKAKDFTAIINAF